MDVQSLIRLVLAKRWLVLGFGVAGGLAAYLLGLILVTYEAEGQVIIRPIGAESLKATERPALGMVSSPYIDNVRQEGLSYISILRSREVIGRVVDQLQLQKKFEGKGTGLTETIKQPLRFLFYGRLPAVKQTPRERAVDRTRKSIRAILISGSSVIQISVKNEDANKAADIANTLMDNAVAFSAERNTRSANEAVTFLESELMVLREKTAEAIDELEKLREAHGIKSTGTVAEQIKELGERIKKMELGVDEHLSALVLAEKRVADIERRIAALPEHKRWSYTIGQNPELETLRQTLLGKKLELANAQVDFLPGSVQIAAKEKSIEITNEAIEAQLETIMAQETFQSDANRDQLTLDLIRVQIDVATLPMVKDELLKRIETYNKQVSDLSAISEAFADLESEIAAFGVTGVKTRDGLNAARMMTNRGLTEFEPLDRAAIPRYPTINDAPLAFYVIAAGCMSMFLAVFYVLYRDGGLALAISPKKKEPAKKRATAKKMTATAVRANG